MPRANLGPLLLNKYIDGFPHLVKLVDVSANGMLVQKVHEPNVHREFYSVELGVPERTERMWLWTRHVWTVGALQALKFIGIDPVDRVRLARMVVNAHAVA
jgi:hypothetical protein